MPRRRSVDGLAVLPFAFVASFSDSPWPHGSTFRTQVAQAICGLEPKLASNSSSWLRTSGIASSDPDSDASFEG